MTMPWLYIAPDAEGELTVWRPGDEPTALLRRCEVAGDIWAVLATALPTPEPSAAPVAPQAQNYGTEAGALQAIKAWLDAPTTAVPRWAIAQLWAATTGQAVSPTPTMVNQLDSPYAVAAGGADGEALPAEDCWCAECDETRRKAALDAGGSFSAYISRCMILCPECGNKRCPRATSHDNACTGSNEPNQPGSAYVYGPTVGAGMSPPTHGYTTSDHTEAAGAGAAPRTYFDVLREMTDDPEILDAIARAEERAGGDPGE